MKKFINLGQTVVVVENRGGAGGSIGSAFVASSAPDGYTLGIATVSTRGINPAIYPNLAFDGQKDFTPVSNVKTRLEALGAEPAANSPEAFSKQIAAEIAKNKRSAKEANVKID